MKKICALLAMVVVSTIASAGVGVVSEPITLGPDGKAYSRFPAGNVDPPPPYEALVWSGAITAIEAAGSESLEHGTPFTYANLRQHITGTNSATCTLSIVEHSGADATDAGWAIDGVDLEFSSTSNTEKSGAFRLKCDDSTSIGQTGQISWHVFILDDPDPPPDPIERDLFMEMDFETGQCQPQGNQVGGVFKDGCNLHQLSSLKTFTITNITRANPAVMSWTGTDPAIYEGVTITDCEGMTEMCPRLVRCQPTAYDATANTCRLYTDGNIDSIYSPATTGVCRAANTTQCVAVNTSTFGVWSSTAVGTTWQRIETQNGGLGPSSNELIHVVQSVTPPSNVNGAANGPVTPLLGTYFLSANAYFWGDHSTFPGNSSRNKVRWNLYQDLDDTDLDPGEEVCASVGVFLPSNYEHRNAGNDDTGNVEHINFHEAGDENILAAISTLGLNTTAEDHWSLEYNSGSGRVKVDLGTVAGDLDKWTVWTIRIKPGTTGTLKVWKSTGGYISGKQRADSLEFSRVGQSILNPASGYRFHVRQYPHGWHHAANFMQTRDRFWVGMDEIRLTRFVADGGTCADVHPFGENLN